MEIGIGNVQTTNQNVQLTKQEVKKEVYEPNIQQSLSNYSIQEKAVIGAIEKANKKFSGDTRELNFSIHEKTKQIVVKVVSKETKEVIREIPPEKILDMVAQMCESAGLFIDMKK